MHVKYFLIILSSCLFLSCKKSWLDAKPNKSLIIPSSLQDYQALLDNSSTVFNESPSINEIGSGDFYVLDPNWQSLYTNTEKNSYIWAPDIYKSETYIPDWPDPYKQVFYANVVLEGLNKLEPLTQQADWNNMNGSALFFRAFAFYNLSQLFAKPYDSLTAQNDLGIPLRLSSDVKEKTFRANVQQTYDQIINDLLASVPLLPITPLYKTRPSKSAAFAMLSRTYLSMRNYEKALSYADSSLDSYNALLDYNTLDTTAQYPIPQFNNEMIFYSALASYYIFNPANLIVDSVLFNSYNKDDLRRTVFFYNNSGYTAYRGSYSRYQLFGGLATDEIFLIKAECYARMKNTNAAMEVLNTLLETRWIAGSFTPLSALDPDDALHQILYERRKELVFRGLRWTDLRRLNKDTQTATTLTHILNGEAYSLEPGDNRYVFPIPDNEIQLSGIQQNPR